MNDGALLEVIVVRRRVNVKMRLRHLLSLDSILYYCMLKLTAMRIENSKRMTLQQSDLASIAKIIKNETDPIKNDVEEVKGSVERLTSSIDRTLRLVSRHDEEWLILRTQHQKMREALVRKGVLTEEELSITA